MSYLVLLYKIKYNFHTILYDAMTWNITTTPTFLNELLNLPRHVTRKLPRKISDIQADPHSVRLDAIRLKNNREVSRVHVGDDYRLFYTFGNGWIKLLSICHRRDCYRRRIPEPTLPDIKTDEDSLEPKTLSNDNKLITEGKLRDWNIPERYWENLLIIKNEDELLSLDIPSNYIFLLIDNLSPRSLDEIEYQNELLVSPEDLESFVEGKLEITKFLLKLSQEQQRLKDLQTNNAILVKGAAGTGKSTLALYRVKKLVDSGVEKILFTTYTESLANYSKYLLKDLLGKSPEQCGVEVSTFDWTAIKYYKQQYGNPLFPEDNGLIFLEYAIKSIPVSQQILLNNLKIEYLLEEIQIIIEARNINDLSSYLQENRYGRKLPLKNRQREAIWEVYKFWKQIMQDSGYISKGLMRQKALEIVQQKQEKPYNAVIIDEAQDLSPVALRLLAEIVVSPSGLYLTADISQSLYQRGFSWNYIQDAIKFKGEVKILRNSYRSTSQITKACTEIFNYLGLLASDGETLSTKPIDLIGDKPTILLIDDPIQQIKKIKDFFITSSKTYRLPVYGGAVLTSDPEIGKIIAQQLNVHGLKAAFMEKDEIDISKHCIKIMTINSSKGFEFPFVTLVGLEEGKLPNLTNIPSEEEDEALKQQLRLFYVGCSRAIANMFPDQPTYYRSAIYVRADSQIQSLSDLKPTTVIAMGDFNSVSSFYVPVYDLYGKSLTVKMGFRGQEIRELIEKGKADVGVGAYGDTIQNNSNIRIIHLSKVIPGSGVYLSPNLPIPDRATLKKVLLHAPKEVKKKANYDLNKEVNYQSLIGIIQKTEKVLECADFTKNPVNFFCHFNKSFSKPVQPINITASVNGFSYINSNMIKLTLEDEKSKIYTLVTFVNLLNQASNGMSVINLQKKQIQIIGAVPKRRADESFEVIITRPNQVKVLN